MAFFHVGNRMILRGGRGLVQVTGQASAAVRRRPLSSALVYDHQDLELAPAGGQYNVSIGDQHSGPSSNTPSHGGETEGTAAPFKVNNRGHRVLTDDDKKEMAALRFSDPKKYTQRALARKFQCSRLQVAMNAPAPPQQALAEAVKRQARMEASSLARRHSPKQRSAKIEEWFKKHQPNTSK